jgi:uncharacterized protein (TIRG00374 family)
MKKALITILQYIIFLGLGIWLVYHMLHKLTDLQKSQLVDAIYSIDPWYLFPICLAGFLSHFFRALRWRYLLEPLDMKPTVVNTTFAVFIGYFFNLLLPRAGEVAKCTVLARYEKMPAHKMIGTIVAERAFDLFCLIIITMAALFSQFHVISKYVMEVAGRLSEDISRHRNVLIASIVGLIVVLLALFLFYRRHKDNKIGRFMKEMTHGVLSILLMKKRWQFIGFTVLIWMMYTLQLYIGLKCLPATNHLSFLAALVVLVYGSIGMIGTPGGIGLYTYLVAQILGAYSIPEVPAQAFGWIAWAVTTAIIIVFGVFSLLLIQSYNRSRDGKVAMDTAQNL